MAFFSRPSPTLSSTSVLLRIPCNLSPPPAIHSAGTGRARDRPFVRQFRLGFWVLLPIFFFFLIAYPGHKAYASSKSPQFQRLDQVDRDVAKILLEARLAMRDLAECNLQMLARLDRLMSRNLGYLARYQHWTFNLLLRMAHQLNEILTDLGDLLPEGPNPALEGLKAGLAATGLIPGVGGVSFTAGLIVQGVEGWANARNAAQAAGIAEDILARADAQVKAFNDVVKINNDIAGAYRELERYQKRIQDLIETFEERCLKAETPQEHVPASSPPAESWRKVAKNVVDEDTGQPLDEATVTLIPKGGGNRTPTPIDRTTPRPGDTIIVSAPCHEEQRFVVGEDSPPSQIKLKKKPIRRMLIGFDCDSQADRKRALKRLRDSLAREGVTFDPQSVEFVKKATSPPACEARIKRYRTNKTCYLIPPPSEGAPTGPSEGPGEGVIEGDLERHGQQVSDLPDDPFFRSRGSWGQPYDDQWAIKRIGFDASGVRLLWPPAAEPVTVAVVDTGVDRLHPDLVGAIWVNEDEIPGNGLDDDHNGFVDDVHGWNFVHGDNQIEDDNGHGTVVAGIIAAGVNNGIGIAGVNPWAVIMPVKATRFDNSGGSIDVGDAIIYAADNGAKVINVSIGGKGLSRYEQLAVDYARKRGAIVVVAAGNEGTNTATFSPAGLKGVITVASTGLKDERLRFSNWGRRVDIAAPGADILSLRAQGTDLLHFESKDYRPGTAFVGSDRGYYRVTGSSFSAPFVSGVASLLLSLRPELTGEQVIRMILHSARDIDIPGWDQYTGYGLLDAKAAAAADPEFFVEARIRGVRVVDKDGEPVLRVYGTSDANAFQRGWIEIGAGKNPKEWKAVSRTITRPVRSSVLGDLKAEHFSGASRWTLRLITEHRNGRRREARFYLRLN